MGEQVMRNIHDDVHVVQARGLTKVYGARRVVDGVDLMVRAGEVYGFLGPNGAGKTTTLRILLGLVRLSEGTVRVLGHRPGDPRGLIGVGALVEGPGLYPYLSGRDNLRVMARYAGVPMRRVDEVLELVNLTDRAADRFATYSLGMKQRLGVAAALLKDPKLLILDEPSNGLDPAGMAEMRRLSRRLGTGERTVLLSSHQLAEVEEICDRVGVISQGRMLAEGTVAELRGEGQLMVRADPLPRAREVAERVLGPQRVSVVDGVLRLRTAPHRAAVVNRALVAADVAVSELRVVERTLEDVFFELTGGAGQPRVGEER